MRVAVLGAGNGGVAAAFDFAQYGHEVALYAAAEFATNTVAVHTAGGITASGDLEGFAPIRYAGHDIAEAMDGAELVVVVGPAYSTEPLATDCAPFLAEGMAVLVCPGSCAGAIAFKRAAGLELGDDRIVVGETSTLPYAVRVTDPGVINVFLKLTTGVYLAGLPRSGTGRLYDLVKQVWPAVEQAESVFQTTLQNGNPVIHPAVTLLNAALLERTGGDFLFYEEGVTVSVGRMIEAVDDERLAVAAALGVPVLSEPAIGAKQGYMLEENYSTGLQHGARLPRHHRTAPAGPPLPDRGRRLLADLPRRSGRASRRAHAGDRRRDRDHVRRPRKRPARRGRADAEHPRPGRPVARGARRALIAHTTVNTETCLVLSPVNGERSQSLQRSRNRIPASSAIRSYSAGKA